MLPPMALTLTIRGHGVRAMFLVLYVLSNTFQVQGEKFMKRCVGFELAAKQ